MAEIIKLFSKQIDPREVVEELILNDMRGIVILTIGKDEQVRMSFSTLTHADLCYALKVMDMEITQLIANPDD